MAKQINFKPAPVDVTVEYERQLAAAPQEHAEALLLLFDILQTAHDQGLLDLAHGAIGAKDMIAGKLAEYAKLPEGVSAIRNLLAMGKLLSAIDPETLDCLSRAITDATAAHRGETRPPTLFELAKRANSEDSRRGLSYLTLILGSLGRSLAK